MVTSCSGTLGQADSRPTRIVARCIDAGGTDSDLVRRQLVRGGVCFSLLALCWIVEEGLRTVPPSKDRIDGLLTELDDLTGELR
jgi:hypothetical protein